MNGGLLCYIELRHYGGEFGNERNVNDKRSVVSELNHVEGFDPASYARVIQKEGQEDQLYLDVAIRKLWFCLKYPLGKIKNRWMQDLE